MLVQSLSNLTANIVDKNYTEIVDASENKSNDIVNIFKIACKRYDSESSFSLLNKSISNINMEHEKGQLTGVQIREIVQNAKDLPENHLFNQSVKFNFDDTQEKIKINKLLLSTVPQFKSLDSNYSRSDLLPMKILATFLENNADTFAEKLSNYSLKQRLITYTKSLKEWNIPELTEHLVKECLAEDLCSLLHVAFLNDDQTVVDRCLEKISDNFELLDDSKEESNRDDLLFIKLFSVACKYKETQMKAKGLIDGLIKHIELKQSNHTLTRKQADQIVIIAKDYLPKDHPFRQKIKLILGNTRAPHLSTRAFNISPFPTGASKRHEESLTSTIMLHETSTAPFEILEMIVHREFDHIIKNKLESFSIDELLNLYQRSVHEWDERDLVNLIFEVLVAKYANDLNLIVFGKIDFGFTIKTNSHNIESLSPILELFKEHKMKLTIEFTDKLETLEEVQSIMKFFDSPNFYLTFYHYYVKINIIKDPETIKIETRYDESKSIEKNDRKG